MKVVIRHPLTRLYRNAKGSWVENASQAEDFGTTSHAVAFCLKENLESYQVIMRHPVNAEFDIVVVEHKANEIPPSVGKSSKSARKNPRK